MYPTILEEESGVESAERFLPTHIVCAGAVVLNAREGADGQEGSEGHAVLSLRHHG